jgi:hypothetical protein
LLFKEGVFSGKKPHKRFFTQGAIFHQESFKIDIINDEEKFFRLLATDPIAPKLPSFVNKAYHKIRTIMS